METVFDLLAKKTNSRMVQYLLAHPSKPVYPAQLVKETKMAKKSVSTAISALEKAGLVSKTFVGKMAMYSLNSKAQLVKHLRALLTLSQLSGISGQLSSEDPNAEFFLFGSAARGENTEKSDIDILVLSDGQPSRFSSIFAKEKNLNIKPVFYRRMDYAMLQRHDPAFYERIEKDKIRLL